MSIENDFIISFYKEISTINNQRHVTLVQHIETGQVYIKKTIPIGNLPVYKLLKENDFPHIPLIKELLTEGENLIVIEEFINGQNLQTILEEKRFSEDDAREIIGMLCKILQPLHNHNPQIIHRDIKPSNLVLDGKGQLYLIDFDAAKVFDPGKNRDTVLMGTADYAAPEQYGFSQSNEKTDIYSIGILLNELLTGKLPVDQLHSGSLKSVINKCIAIDPAKRFSSVTTLRKNLTFVEGEYSFIPPGFRGKNIFIKILAAVGYALLIYGLMTSEFTDANGRLYDPVILYVNRIMVTFMMLSFIFYLGDFAGLRNRFPYRKRFNKLSDIFRIALGCFIIMMGSALIAVIGEAII